jgi:carbon storage regulator
MLMISRHVGERIVIGDEVEIIVAEIHRRTVRLGVRGGGGMLVLRGEIRDAIEAANRRAAESALDEEAISKLGERPREGGG